MSADDLAPLIAAEAKAQNVDPALALRIWRAEGAGDMTARSPKGAVGPMQLEPDTASGLGVNPYSLQGNIKGGVTYLKQQLDRFGDPRLAAAAYNAGPGAVLKHGGVPPYRETKRYVDTVMGGAKSDPIADAIFSGGPGMTAQAPTGGAQADPAADAIFSASPGADAAPAAPPPPPPTAPRPTTSSQMLGAYKGFVSGPLDRMASAMEGGAREVGLPVDAINRFGARLGLYPNAEAANAAHQAFLSREAQRGVAPGKVGQFGGNVAFGSLMPGGPAVSGALSGAALSNKTDLGGVLGDAAMGAVGGKVGSKVMEGAGKLLSGVTDPAVAYLAKAGVPLTVGQVTGGVVRDLEDKATSVPILGDMIRNAQRRGLQGANRAAYNETLGQVGEKLPDNVDVGRGAFNYTKQRLSDLYETTLSRLGTLHPDAQLSGDLGAVASKLNAIGDGSIRDNAQKIIQSEVLSRFKGGALTGEDMKAAQEALGKHIQDLSKGTKWSRDAAGVLGDVKSALEGLASRTNPEAGDMLARVNAAYARLKPIEAATASTSAKDGIFTLGGLNQSVARSRSKGTVAAGKAPLQDLSNAAAKVLPSTVPDSGTAGRYMIPTLMGGVMAGHLPVVGPAAVPATGLIGGAAALYTRAGQKAITALAKSHNPVMVELGRQLGRLSAPAGLAGAALLVGSRQ